MHHLITLIDVIFDNGRVLPKPPTKNYPFTPGKRNLGTSQARESTRTLACGKSFDLYVVEKALELWHVVSHLI